MCSELTFVCSWENLQATHPPERPPFLLANQDERGPLLSSVLLGNSTRREKGRRIWMDCYYSGSKFSLLADLEEEEEVKSQSLHWPFATQPRGLAKPRIYPCVTHPAVGSGYRARKNSEGISILLLYRDLHTKLAQVKVPCFPSFWLASLGNLHRGNERRPNN